MIIERIDKTLPLPVHHTNGAAGFDLYVAEEVRIEPYQRGFYSCNLKMDIPEGHYIQILPRSSSFKTNMWVFPGVIDSDYKKEVKLGIYNTGGSLLIIIKGQRVAQAILHKLPLCELREGLVIDNDRGGFGSTSSWC